MAGQIIVLNGSPRSGKSTIASAIQESFHGVWMNIGLDNLKKATPERFQPGIGLRPGGERPDLEPLVKTLYLAMYESIAAHSRLGVNVVADTTHHDHYSQPMNILSACASIVADLPVLFVGVRRPIEAVVQRRIATWGQGREADGSIPLPVRRWQEAVHRSWTYDIEVNTAHTSPGECAAVISERLTNGPPTNAFRKLAHSGANTRSPNAHAGRGARSASGAIGELR
jgi:chloramphenicol 3-O phosphotransferase